jgi:hypothetical protein
MLINPELVALMVDGLRNATANGHDLSKMSDLDIGSKLLRPRTSAARLASCTQILGSLLRSRCEVAITYDGRVVATHPKFRLDWDDLEDEREEQRRQRRLAAEGKPQEEISAAPTPTNRWRELLETIFGADSDYVEYRSNLPRRRLVLIDLIDLTAWRTKLKERQRQMGR